MGQNIKKLAGRIASLSEEQSEIKDNISPEEPGAALNLFFRNDIRVTGQVTLTKKVHSGTSFVLDHPVYGELDSAVLALDGGYDESQTEIIETKSF